MTWDAALRRGDWDEARALLVDDATFAGPDGSRCESADEIVDLMRSFKGTVPDVELLRLDVRGDYALAHLRQPAWDAEWYQVLTVHDDRIVDLTDYDSLEQASAAVPPG
jgi:hypothetical protein